VPKILVVDDEPSNRAVVRAVLTPSGHDVLEASNAEEALAVVREHRPDLVLTDLGLPAVSGADFIKTLRDDPATADLSIALYTGTHSSAMVRDFMALLNVRHYIQKPCEPGELLATVEAALQQPCDCSPPS